MINNQEEFDKHIAQPLEVAKQKAIQAYHEHRSKKKAINEAVVNFVLSNPQPFSPHPRLLKDYQMGKYVSFNTMIESIGDYSTLIGATAFRLAEQLEIELVDNGIESNTQATALYVNGHPSPDYSFCDVPLSKALSRYFEQEPFSIFQHNQYWFQHILDTTPKDDHTKRQILIGYISLQKLCFAPAYSLFIYDALKRLNAEPDIKTDIVNLDILKDDVATQLDNHEFDSDDKDRQTALSVLDGITKVMNHFIYLAKMQE
jgi:hypothetical protein